MGARAGGRRDDLPVGARCRDATLRGSTIGYPGLETALTIRLTFQAVPTTFQIMRGSLRLNFILLHLIHILVQIIRPPVQFVYRLVQLVRVLL